jgi:molybdate transport system ATP-binding protein
VLVTHDLLGAVALADRMAVIEDGGIVQAGTAAEVTARPRSRHVAELVGVNLLRGTARGSAVNLDGGGRLVTAAVVPGTVLAVIPPAAVSGYRQRPDPEADNLWLGQVSAVDLLGDRVRVRIGAAPSLVAEVTPSAVDELKLDHGGELWACLDPSDVIVYTP